MSRDSVTSSVVRAGSSLVCEPIAVPISRPGGGHPGVLDGGAGAVHAESAPPGTVGRDAFGGGMAGSRGLLPSRTGDTGRVPAVRSSAARTRTGTERPPRGV
jgi:hypothetical protein